MEFPSGSLLSPYRTLDPREPLRPHLRLWLAPGSAKLKWKLIRTFQTRWRLLKISQPPVKLFSLTRISSETINRLLHYLWSKQATSKNNQPMLTHYWCPHLASSSPAVWPNPWSRGMCLFGKCLEPRAEEHLLTSRMKGRHPPSPRTIRCSIVTKAYLPAVWFYTSWGGRIHLSKWLSHTSALISISLLFHPVFLVSPLLSVRPSRAFPTDCPEGDTAEDLHWAALGAQRPHLKVQTYRMATTETMPTAWLILYVVQ